jgi:hypothetical protein
MRFVLTIGRLTMFDFTLFEIKDRLADPDVVVVHHYDGSEDESPDGPRDMFGDKD